MGCDSQQCLSICIQHATQGNSGEPRGLILHPAAAQFMSRRRSSACRMRPNPSPFRQAAPASTVRSCQTLGIADVRVQRICLPLQLLGAHTLSDDGARVVGTGTATHIMDAFLGATFEGGRHATRVAKINPQ